MVLAPIRRYLDITPQPANAVNLYRQGATTTQAVTVPGNGGEADVSVAGVGRVRAADTLKLGLSTTTVLAVSTTPPDKIRVRNDSAGPVTISAGTRLIPTNDRPIFYDAIFAPLVSSKGLNPNSTHVTGFISEPVLDYTLTGPGYSTTLVTDYRGLVRWTTDSWLNAAEFPDIQAAIDALPPLGGTVYVPQGTYSVGVFAKIGKQVSLID